MADTTKPSCAGCIGCGGPDCIERPEPPTEGRIVTARRWDWLLHAAAATAAVWALIFVYALWELR